MTNQSSEYGSAPAGAGWRIQAGDNRTFKDAQEVSQRLRNARNNALFFSFTFLSHAETRAIKGLRRLRPEFFFASAARRRYAERPPPTPAGSCRPSSSALAGAKEPLKPTHLERLARILILRKRLFLICSKAVAAYRSSALKCETPAVARSSRRLERDAVSVSVQRRAG
jgi:hypothetical protein